MTDVIRVGRKGHIPFVQVPYWLTTHVSPQAVVLYMHLYNFTDYRTGEALHPVSRRNLAELMGYSRPQSVDNLVKELVGVGVLTVEKSFKPGTKYRNPSTYLLNMGVDAPAGKAEEEGEHGAVDRTMDGAVERTNHGAVDRTVKRTETYTHAGDTDNVLPMDLPRSEREITKLQFEAWYKVYPHKPNPSTLPALAAFKAAKTRMKQHGITFEDLIARTKKYAEVENSQFYSLPENWLKQDKWAMNKYSGKVEVPDEWKVGRH